MKKSFKQFASMKLFSKKETISLIIIFTILVAVSIPNFIASLRKARDQTRRDDLGSLVGALGNYYLEFSEYPLSSPDGRVLDCLKPGDKMHQDEKGRWVGDIIPCIWGKDALANLITGNKYLLTLPIDPNWKEGASYFYISNGQKYQIFMSMEGKNEPEVDPRIIARNLPCGNKICNVGRSRNCDTYKTIEQCVEEDIQKLSTDAARLKK